MAKLHFVYRRMRKAEAWCGRVYPVERQVDRADRATCAACWQAMGRAWAETQRVLSPPDRVAWSKYRPPTWDEYIAGMSVEQRRSGN